MKSNSCKNNRRAMMALLLCTGFIAMHPLAMSAKEDVSSLNVVQQQKSVSGVIKDSTGEPVDNPTNGTITDLDGKFILNVAQATKLEISFIGYKTVVVDAIPGKTIDVKLEDDSEMLDEVVVVGFGTQKKVNLTGSVGVVTAEELKERPVTNAAQALQGVVPGLQITQTNGSLEDTPSINVRGTTTIGQGTSGDPLVLIDGMEGDLNTINPQDIANISVLKDAAASSIYGSRAPFGVILITTKSGSKEGKTSINYNNSFRWGTPINMNHMMNSVDFLCQLDERHLCQFRKCRIFRC